MNDFVRSFVSGTGASGLRPTANMPVRLYLTGTTSPDRVIPCTGGEDNAALGIARRGVVTAGLAVAVAMNYGFQFLAQVNTTVAQGAPLAIKDRSQFKAASVTAGNHFCARVEKARTNAGLTWLTWVGNGTV